MQIDIQESLTDKICQTKSDSVLGADVSLSGSLPDWMLFFLTSVLLLAHSTAARQCIHLGSLFCDLYKAQSIELGLMQHLLCLPNTWGTGLGFGCCAMQQVSSLAADLTHQNNC